MNHRWNGVFPAITTQMSERGEIDFAATARHVEVLIDSGIAGWPKIPTRK